MVLTCCFLYPVLPQSHSMDFDDTWHPATHPSGAVLPALLAISDMLPGNSKPSGLDFLLAFNVGIEIQGRLLRFSNEACNIPKRWVKEEPFSSCYTSVLVLFLVSRTQDCVLLHVFFWLYTQNIHIGKIVRL